MRCIAIIVLLAVHLIQCHYACGQELRIGMLLHNVQSRNIFPNFDQGIKQKNNSGYDVNLEYIFDDKYKFLHTSPHIGISVNSRGYTSSLYTGLTLHFDSLKYAFVEAGLGIAVHNGVLHPNNKDRNALGSRVLCRGSFSLGVIFKDKHSMAVITDHMSHGYLFSKHNKGLTNFGIRYGYKL